MKHDLKQRLAHDAKKWITEIPKIMDAYRHYDSLYSETDKISVATGAWEEDDLILAVRSRYHNTVYMAQLFAPSLYVHVVADSIRRGCLHLGRCIEVVPSLGTLFYVETRMLEIKRTYLKTEYHGYIRNHARVNGLTGYHKELLRLAGKHEIIKELQEEERKAAMEKDDEA